MRSEKENLVMLIVFSILAVVILCLVWTIYDGVTRPDPSIETKEYIRNGGQ